MWGINLPLTMKTTISAMFVAWSALRSRFFRTNRTTTGLKITTDLERIGDSAVNISERVVELNQEPHVEPLGRIIRMAGLARSMAESVIARDTEVDALTYEISAELLV